MCKDHEKHHHAHHHLDEKTGIRVSHHEGASIFNITKEFPLPYKEMLSVIPEKLSGLSAWVNENGGFVGHIKGYMTDTSHCAMLSTTGGTCNVAETTDPAIKLELTCIVFMVDERKMCEKITQILTF